MTMDRDARRSRLREEIAAWSERLNAVQRTDPSSDRFSAAMWNLVRESGILRLPFDPTYGGRGEDLLTTMYVLEALGHGCREGGLNFSVCTQIVGVGVPLQRSGSEQLKQRYLPRICDGSAIGAHAITEPAGGSDALAMQTRAVDRGDHYVLDGTKAFVTHAPVADVFVVYAKTRPEGGPLGITAFVVDRDTPGLSTSEAIPKMGLKGSPVGELVLDGCEVDAANVIGRPGSGFFVLDHVMKWEILCSFITSVGAMEHRLERCIEYARTREQFGKPIAAFQAIAHKIVDMRIAIETARRWLYATAADFAAGKDTTADIAISKLVASEANVSCALAAMQIFGGNGYTTAFGLEADLRDAVGGTIYSGTSEIQRNRIAATLGLRDRAGAPRVMELR
jgi:alkylation response protein AidB-like acyl-CoA dehydrogenase